jgi:hypothetical protein
MMMFSYAILLLGSLLSIVLLFTIGCFKPLFLPRYLIFAVPFATLLVVDQLFEIKKVQLRAQKFYNLTKIKSLFFFTDRKKIYDLKQVLKNLPQKTCIIFREYDLTNPEREQLATEYLKISRQFGHSFFVGKDFNLALKIKCDGVHFSDNDLEKSLLKIRYSCKKNKLIFSKFNNFLSNQFTVFF